MTKIEQLNQGVRAFCVIALLGGFIFAFVWGVMTKVAIVDGATYVGVLTLALTWWFKSRDEQAAKISSSPTLSPSNGPPS